MSSTILRPWQGIDLELIESRDVVLLRPQADPAIGQKGAIPNGEEPRIIKRDRELIALGDQAKLVPMIERDVRLGSPDPLHPAAQDAKEVDTFLQRTHTDHVVIIRVHKTEGDGTAGAGAFALDAATIPRNLIVP